MSSLFSVVAIVMEIGAWTWALLMVGDNGPDPVMITMFLCGVVMSIISVMMGTAEVKNRHHERINHL